MELNTDSAGDQAFVLTGPSQPQMSVGRRFWDRVRTPIIFISKGAPIDEPQSKAVRQEIMPVDRWAPQTVRELSFFRGDGYFGPAQLKDRLFSGCDGSLQRRELALVPQAEMDRIRRERDYMVTRTYGKLRITPIGRADFSREGVHWDIPHPFSPFDTQTVRAGVRLTLSDALTGEESYADWITQGEFLRHGELLDRLMAKGTITDKLANRWRWKGSLDAPEGFVPMFDGQHKTHPLVVRTRRLAVAALLRRLESDEPNGIGINHFQVALWYSFPDRGDLIIDKVDLSGARVVWTGEERDDADSPKGILSVIGS